MKQGVVSANAHRDHDRPSDLRDIAKTQAVTSHNIAVSVAIGGNGKLKARAVVAREAAGGISEEKAEWQCQNRKSGLAPGNLYARSWAECCALQGMPPDWLMETTKDGKLHSPLFTKEGRFTLLGNGVPIPMGRAVAKAVRRATQ